MIVRESINFERGQDPKTAMGIGKLHLIKKYVDSICQNDNYTSKNDFLWICAENGKLDYVKYLLDIGADVHTESDYSLQVAAHRGHLDVVKVLLKAGADATANNGRALRWAINRGHSEIIKLLDDWLETTGLPLKKDDPIKESVNFERGQDPKKAMKIGKASWWDDIIENTPWYMELNTYGDFKVIDLIKDYRGVSPIIVIRIEQNDIRVEPTYWYIGVSKVDKTGILDTPEEALHDAKIDIENWEYREAEHKRMMDSKK